MRALDFVKMHGLGNDFVILDARAHALTLDTETARTIADRHRGVGCDQILIIEPAKSTAGTAFMRIRNADGSEAEACGNGARCVAALLMEQNKTDRVVLETLGGPVAAEHAGDHRIAVDMGEPRLGWREIPLAQGLRHAACAAEPRAAERSGLHQHGQSACDLLRRPISPRST